MARNRPASEVSPRTSRSDRRCEKMTQSLSSFCKAVLMQSINVPYDTSRIRFSALEEIHSSIRGVCHLVSPKRQLETCAYVQMTRILAFYGEMDGLILALIIRSLTMIRAMRYITGQYWSQKLNQLARKCPGCGQRLMQGILSSGMKGPSNFLEDRPQGPCQFYA